MRVIIPITWVLLALYAAGILFGLMSPSSDPQRGMAQGFLTMALLLMAGVAALFWYGAKKNKRVIVWIVFVLCAYVAVNLTAQGVFHLLND